jgi:hypothetical protein
LTDLAFETSRAISMVTFFFYGWACLASNYMVAEFERYRLPQLRKLTGTLEIAGALGLLLGYMYPVLVVLASGGLSLLMLLGIATRLRIRDPIVASLPALVLFIMNAYVLAFSLYRDSV